METWEAWTPQRFIFLFVGLAYLLVWIQVLLYHWRGAFRHRPMWEPVLTAPLLAAMGIVFAFMYGGFLNLLFILLFAIGAFVGVSGIFFHFRGVHNYIGGFSLRNFMVGPPVILPMTFMVFSVVALLVYFVWSLPEGGGYA
ncbi:MAG: hypothetical protein ACYC9O_20165, partial [Candidatus Latescibacterota bacterium]